MMVKGPIAQGVVHHLLMHMEHVVEMVESIIKETDLDPCAKQTTEDLGASCLFYLSRVCFLPQTLFHSCVYYFVDGRFDFKCWGA